MISPTQTPAITNLETLQQRKAELATLCKQKETEISTNLDFIGDNIGKIAINSLTGYNLNQSGNAKAEIINMLVSEGIDTALSIHADPTNLREKIIAFVKKIAAGIVQVLTK